MNALVTTDLPFVPYIGNRSVANVWKWFVDYQLNRGLSFARPDIQGFVDYQLGLGKQEHTVLTYLNHLRGVYRRLLMDSQFQEWIFSQAAGDNLADKIIIGNQIIQTIRNALDNVRISVTVKQDDDYRNRRWLTRAEQIELIASPTHHLPLNPNRAEWLIAYRDSVLFDLILSAGLRPAEAVNVRVTDLRAKYVNHLALLVRAGKGNKQRLIPYGAMVGIVERVEQWLKEAGITEGYVFRQINKGGKVGGALNHQTITDWILPQYPIWIESEQASVIVKAHDLRRSYARRQYEAGMKLEALQANLGHSDLKTTLHYVGELNGDDRAGR